MAWTPIKTMRRGHRPDFSLLREPENIYVTRAQMWFTDQLVALEEDTLISGRYSHKAGYHDTVAHNDARSGVAKDYSTRDPEDRRGPRNKGRASDWTFRDAQAGDYASFEKYGDRLMVAYRNGDPRVNGWREYLGRVSTAVVVNGVRTRRVGIDFRHRYLRIPDDTHDWHAHFSEDTEQVESFWNKWALLTALAGWTLAEWQQSIAEEDMTPEQAKQLADLHSHFVSTKHPWAQDRNTARLMTDMGYAFLYGLPGTEGTWLGKALTKIGAELNLDPAELSQIRGAIAAELAPVAAELKTEIDEVAHETVNLMVEQSSTEAAQAIIAAVGPARASEIMTAIGQELGSASQGDSPAPV